MSAFVLSMTSAVGAGITVSLATWNIAWGASAFTVILAIRAAVLSANIDARIQYERKGHDA